jgi:Uma2 family endonuclease
MRKAVPEPARDELGEIIYPSEDGLPMSYNTVHFDWITFIKLGLEIFFSDRPDVFVAGDLLWYPVQGHPEIRVGPDVFVAFGRPKGDRTSYRQWEEGNVAPRVVFEVLSPGNTIKEMLEKQGFYSRYGVQEYVVFHPAEDSLMIWTRDAQGTLEQVDEPQGWRSPLMDLTFWTAGEGKLHIVLPDGSQMLSTLDIEAKRREAETLRLEEKARADKLAAKLKELGIDPDGV